MPNAVDAYICRFCDSIYLDMDDAYDCMHKCLREEPPDTVDAFACARCGEPFYIEDHAIEHEKKCTHTIREEEPGKETSLTCRNCDAEGHRWRPCPEYHFAKIRPACEHYEYARD